MGKILVTGGFGFIGSHLCERLVKDGHNVFIYDNKVNRKVTAIARTTVVSYQDFYHSAWDYIIHLAAKGAVIPGCDLDLIESNIIFAKQVLSTPYRTLYASSAAVDWPMTQYSWSKIYNEKLGSMHPNATGFRFQNIYGPRDNGVIGKLIRAAITGDTFTINGGHQKRDYVWVGDIVDVIMIHLNSKEKIVEVGTSDTYSVNELVEIVQNITGKQINTTRVPFPTHEAEESSARHAYPGMVSLTEGIKKYYAWINSSL